MKSSVQLIRSVVSNSLWPHGLEHARLPCPSPAPGDHILIKKKKKNSAPEYCKLISVQFSHLVVSDSLQPHEPQHARPPCPSPTPRVHPNPCPLSRDAIQLSHPLSSSSLTALDLSQHQGLFQWVSLSNQVTKVLEFQLQHESFQWTPRTDLP